MSVRKIAFVNEGKIKISPENMIYERRKSFVGVYGSLGKRSQIDTWTSASQSEGRSSF